ncbi:MAG: flagellar brake protein [Burkholderia sp.]|nr:flagellar brake protein [Burkholderia sp.]
MNLPINIGVDDVGPYLIHSRREIIALLRRLTEKREFVRMIFSEGEEAIATAVLEVGEDSVIIDSAPDAAQLARVLASSSISFDTALERIRIAFFATRIEPCVHDGLPALRIPLPETMVRLQRREYYRVLTPRCSIQMEKEGGPPPVSFAVQNVSAGGIALIDDEQVLDASKGAEYTNCELLLPGTQSVIATLCVMNCCDISLYNGRTARRIGCAFVNPTAAMLALVQRYVSKLERDQNARLHAGVL